MHETLGQRHRPGPLRWIWYAAGGSLPAEHRTWVLHDVTCRTWQLRHLARVTLQLAPVAVLLFVLIPGPPWVRLMAVLAGVLMGYFYGLVCIHETVEHRAVKAGYPLGTAAATRAQSNAGQTATDAERYAARWRRPPQG